MTPTSKAQWQIHFCVILWGFTAILGKLITLPALALVWWRMLIVVAALAMVPAVWRGLRAMPPRLVAAYAGIGCLVALHWLTFYGAIKLANASVAATCMGVGPAFLALVEPWLTGKRFDARELALGVLVIPGVVLVAGGVPAAMHLGLGVGILTGLVGTGGGFLFVPALVLLARLPMKTAVGTSLFVITLSTAAGAFGYRGQAAVPWGVVALFTLIAIVGIFIGTRLLRFVSQQALRRAFAYFLFGMAGFVLYQNRAVIAHPFAALRPSSAGAR